MSNLLLYILIFLTPIQFATATCYTQVYNAKKDIDSGKLILFQHVNSIPRYHNEMEKICRSYGIKLIIKENSPSDSGKCYEETMNDFILKKFGHDFEQKIIARADSLYTANSFDDTIPFYFCDKEPYTIYENKKWCRYLPDVNASGIGLKEFVKAGNYNRPFLDINFFVDTTGIPNGFVIKHFGWYILENKGMEKVLFDIAVAAILQKHPIWTPGELAGKKVVTSITTRIRFNE